MWCTEDPDALLRDNLTASGSGLDADITLGNAEFQLDGIAHKWT